MSCYNAQCPSQKLGLHLHEWNAFNILLMLHYFPLMFIVPHLLTICTNHLTAGQFGLDQYGIASSVSTEAQNTSVYQVKSI